MGRSRAPAGIIRTGSSEQLTARSFTGFGKMELPRRPEPPEAALVPPRLEWSTNVVHSTPTRPPWLLAKLLRANGF
jgi:hypothetical protein